MKYDFSKPETKRLYEDEVRKRQALGMDRAQAEMLVAALMMTLPTPEGPSTQEK